MKAEDTVMWAKNPQILWDIAEAQNKLLFKQAEISFKAGQESGCFAEGWAIGIKEVVDAVHQLSPLLHAGQDIQTVAANSCKGGDTSYLMLRLLDWQAKLKKWGISE